MSAGACADQAGNVVTRVDEPVAAPGAVDLRPAPPSLLGRYGRDGDRRSRASRPSCSSSPGSILWWRTRRTFRSSGCWPKRLEPARRSSCSIATWASWWRRCCCSRRVTGTMMIFKPFAAIVIAPFGAAEHRSRAHEAAQGEERPARAAGPTGGRSCSRRMRVSPMRGSASSSIPRKAGDPIAFRMRRAAEWLPNGRTTRVRSTRRTGASAGIGRRGGDAQRARRCSTAPIRCTPPRWAGSPIGWLLTLLGAGDGDAGQPRRLVVLVQASAAAKARAGLDWWFPGPWPRSRPCPNPRRFRRYRDRDARKRRRPARTADGRARAGDGVRRRRAGVPGGRIDPATMHWRRAIRQILAITRRGSRRCAKRWRRRGVAVGLDIAGDAISRAPAAALCG